MLGLDRDSDFKHAEREHPDVMLLLGSREGATDQPDASAVLAAVGAADWAGTANRLSERHFQDWLVIEQVAKACHKPLTTAPPCVPPQRPEPLPSDCDEPAMALIR